MQQSKNENLSYRTARLPYWVIGVTTAILMLGMVGYSFFQGNRLVTTYAPLVDAAMEIKLEATMAHLWFAEILSNDRFVEIEDVWFHLEQAEWYAQAMLDGGENAEGRFVPLDDPVMRQQIEAVRTQLTVFRDIAQQRYELGVLVTTDADIDEQYDAEFEDFIEKADQVETELQQLMAQDLNRFRVIQTGLIIGGLLFFVGLGFSYNQLDKRRLQDLSLRNKVQRALRESEEKHRLLANNTLDVIWLMNLELKFTYVNQSVRTLLDFAPEEWIGSTLPDHCPPEEMAKMAGLIAREMADLPNQMGVVFESEFYHKDGTAVPVEIQSTILLDENGQPVGLQGTTRDIRERKKAEAERETLLAQVQEQAKQMNEIMRTVPQGVILLDAVGQIISANKIAAQDLKLLANAAVGEKITQMGNRALSELLTSPPTKGLWHEVQAGNRIFEIISRPVANGPEPEKWVLVSNDVTREREVREKMEQQERLAAVGQLAAGIAHDFNNILAVITLYSELSTFAEGLPDDVQKRLGTITQQAHHASRLVQQILDFSRRAVLELRSLDLAILLKEQVKLLQRTLPENIKIDLNCSPDDYLINADPTRMQQMIMNLAVNARDALPEGGHLHLELKKIRFETKNQSPLVEIEPGEWIVLSVHDDGIGMPPDVLAHIFEPFFTTKPTGTGNGLGLAQVHGIVGQHGGHIAVESTVNEGTIFRIYLPSLPLVVEEMRLLNLDDIPLGRGELVLVVEDNAVWRMTLVESLQTLAYEVIEASDGQEALAKMAEYGERVALILSDVVMPQMGGVALFHALQKADWQTPIIFMSGHPMENDLEELEGPGLKRFLVKPVNYEDLAQSVAEAIRG